MKKMGGPWGVMDANSNRWLGQSPSGKMTMFAKWDDPGVYRYSGPGDALKAATQAKAMKPDSGLALTAQKFGSTK